VNITNILTTPVGYTLIGVAVAYCALKLHKRLTLSAAKHKSLTGHARMSRQLAKWIPYYEYSEMEFFCCDQAPASIAQKRKSGFERLSQIFSERFSKARGLAGQTYPHVSDMQLVSRNRVPFQFSRYVRERLGFALFATASGGVKVTDVDGNEFYDLTGSYGVNVLGYDFYKDCMAKGAEHVRDLGPVLGAYHPIIAYNVKRLCEISGMDEVSFHMSGTEAVMQAVRLARYHTGKNKIVRFSGAYHGWWGDVQPGVGNPLPANDTYTLSDMSEATLKVLRTRRDIACVLVNSLQSFHPNANAPGDSMLIDSGRKAHVDREQYAKWLQVLREVCTQRNIALIIDDVFMGFRLAPGGSQEYFGIRADMVTYGKTLGGGMPIGVVCGKSAWMQRYREDRPADICFARGTFNSHPHVMGAMYEFLQRLDSPEVQALYANLDARWNQRARYLNDLLEASDLPVRVANLSTIWTVLYQRPSRYNWMFQYYLRAEGLQLSLVGTGRFIFSLNYSEQDFAAVVQRFIAAAIAMRDDGWWWQAPYLTNKWIKRRVLKEIAARILKRKPDETTPKPAADQPLPTATALSRNG
jgi:glutamate-1-semialdehyde 2,1-aminomutase